MGLLLGVGLRRATQAARYIGLAARAAGKRIRRPGDLVYSLKRTRDILASSGIAGLMAALRAVTNDYQHWIAAYDTLGESDFAAMREGSRRFAHSPLISVIMPVYNTPERLLREAIDSVLAQTYGQWELCIADDASTEPHVGAILKEYAARESRIRVVHRSMNGHISRASNTALEIASGEWVALLDHDDQLAPHALYSIVDAINRRPDVKLIYSDVDKIDLHGRRHTPYFKCDWNPMLLLSHNLVSHLSAYKTALVRELGGFRTGLEGAQDYDLALRMSERLAPDEIEHIPHILYHWRSMPGSTALDVDEKPYALLAGERALNDHFARTDTRATAHLIGFGYRVDYELPDPPPLVSIIIPIRNARELTEQCILSIHQLTSYPRYEIILVDNGSDDARALAYIAELAEQEGVRVLRDERPFNFSALNNAAVRLARGTVLALVNNDIEILSADWLTRMVSLALQPGAGAVGAKLLYPDGTIQHGGVIMGLGGLAAHAHKRLPRHARGYFGRAALAHNVSAVTAACLVVRKDVYERAGGLNEVDLAIAYNDIDFCLKLTRLGLRNIWTPFVEMIHHELATRGYETSPAKLERFSREKAFMGERWRPEIERDPAYSPNLSLEGSDFGLASPPRQPWPWRPVSVPHPNSD